MKRVIIVFIALYLPGIHADESVLLDMPFDWVIGKTTEDEIKDRASCSKYYVKKDTDREVKRKILNFSWKTTEQNV